MAKHILVVDDEAQIRELLDIYLTRQGYDVFTASNSEQALRFLHQGSVDLVILHIGLAGEDGLTLLPQLKTEWPKLRVAIFTGMGFVEDLLAEAYQKGADAYFSKVLPLDELMKVVEQLLDPTAPASTRWYEEMQHSDIDTSLSPLSSTKVQHFKNQDTSSELSASGTQPKTIGDGAQSNTRELQQRLESLEREKIALAKQLEALEQQVLDSQRLESVGRLAAGVAHDFNNILTIIQGHSDRLLAECDGDEATTEPLRQVSNAAKRGAGLTQQLLMFSRKQVMQSKVIDLNAVVHNLVKMLHRLIGDNISLEPCCASVIPAIEADPGMIEQIIVNLALNARDAMPEGGELFITTEEVNIDNTYVRDNPTARIGRFVALSVRDTGCGMAPETLQRIFEPFFTTKEPGRGTGLGLATVSRIIKQHQGWINVSSELRVGTTFRIYFPATDRPMHCAHKDPSPAKPRGGNETILLVEDEPVLRELARVILHDYAYRVLEAATGVEALKVFELHCDEIDLLFTNIVMPEGIDGLELAEQLKAKKPNLKIIYTSGYTSDAIGTASELSGASFLQKPYSPPRLAQVLRECLDDG